MIWHYHRKRILVGLLTVLIAFSFEMVACSKARKKKEASPSPSKVSSTKTVENPLLSLDLSSKSGIADITVKACKSPLKVSDKNTKFLGLDFDGIGKDSTFPCSMFGEKTIYFDENWTAPLTGCDRIKNLMNLEGKMKEIRAHMLEALIDHAGSLSWVSDAKTVGNYVMVVNTSISQLAYLISRLKSTLDAKEDFIKRIRKMTVDHLKALASFSFDIMEHSGRFGLTHLDDATLDPIKYFDNLLAQRSEFFDSGFDDEMLGTFVNFIYESFGESHCESLNGFVFERTMADFWIPLPIEYLRNRMLYDNYEQMMRFVSNWRLKAFGGAKFDSRHLISLGLLLQQGFVSYESLSATMDFAYVNCHQSQYKLNEEMIKFLTFTASTPWLLPADPEAARLIGDFSNPQLEHHSKYLDAEKAAMIENIWRFFVNPAELVEMKEEDYLNLCRLINRMDKAFPGIYGKLWSLFGDSNDERNGIRFVNGLKSKIEHFDQESENLNWSQKLEFLRDDLEIVKTLEDLKLDSATLLLLVEFVTEMMSNGYEELSEAVDACQVHEFESEIKEVLTLSVTFIDLFLEKYAVKPVIDWWYAKYDYIPTALCSVLFDLWISGDANNLNVMDSLIYENLTKLVDYNLNFARAFMLMQKSKTRIHLFPALSAKASTPKILVEIGESDALNLELFKSYIEVTCSAGRDGILSDFFFVSLSDKLAKEEISFESALELFLELEEKFETISFDPARDGYANFWNPNLMITVLKYRGSPVILRVFKSYLNNLRKKGTVEITTEFLRSLSTFTGFIREVVAVIAPEKSAKPLPDELFEGLVLRPNATETELESLALTLMNVFHFSFANSGISIKTAKAVYDKLFAISKTLRESNHCDENSDTYADTIYAFNCVFLAISRVASLEIHDDLKTIFNYYEFYSKFYNMVPECFENLMHSLVKKSASLVSLCSKIISNGDILPGTTFSIWILKENNLISKLQSSYITNFGQDYSQYNQVYLGPIIEWIKAGKVAFEIIMKLMKLLTPDVPFSKFLNFVPVITTALKCPNYNEKQKIEILETAFSEENDEFIRTLSNLRNTLSHESFIELCHVEESKAFIKFMGKCTTDIWYDGLRIEMHRAAKRKLLRNSDLNTPNYTKKSEEFRSIMMDFVSSGSPDYLLRRSTVHRIDEFMAKDANVLPLNSFNLASKRPLEMCHVFLTSLHWEIVDGTGCFFKVIPKPESFLELLNSHSMLFKNSPRRKALLGWIFESAKSPQIRGSIIKMIPQLITSDNFVLTSLAIQKIAKWTVMTASPSSESASFIQDFVKSAVHKVFEVIQKLETSEEAPVFDKMLTVLCELFTMEVKEITNSRSGDVHKFILDEIMKLQRSGHFKVIKYSRKLMEYLKLAYEALREGYYYTSQVTSFIQGDDHYSIKLTNFLQGNVDFYVKNPMEWIIIWKALSEENPQEFLSARMKVYKTLGCAKFSKWEPLISSLQALKLPANVLVNVVDAIVSKDDFEFTNLGLLLMLPDTLEYEDFASFSQVENLTKCIKMTIDYFKDKEESSSEESCGSETESDEGSSNELTTNILEKLFVLIDFESRSGKPREWFWKQFFGLLNFSDNLRDNELLLMTCLLETYPDLMERTLHTEGSVLKFIFELGQLKHKDSYARFSELMGKAVALYDKFTGSKSLTIYETDTELLNIFNSQLAEIRQMSLKVEKKELLLIIGTIEEFKLMASDILPAGRQDNYAQLVFLYAFAVIEVVYNNVQVLDKDQLKVFSNQITEMIALAVKRDNLIGLAKVLRLKDIPAFISIVTLHADRHEDCALILAEMMKISPENVADDFFEQIQYSTFRKDVCMVSEEIICEYMTVTADAFEYITEDEWPVLYLEGLLGEGDVIDPKHFNMISRLMEQLSEPDNINFLNIFEKLSQVALKYPQNTSDIFDFIDELLENEKYKTLLDINSIYSGFFTDELTSRMISVSERLFLNFIKKLKKRSEESFDSWIKKKLKPETSKSITKALQSDAKSTSFTLHTRIAEAMISSLQDLDVSNEVLSNILKRFKTLEIKSVEPEVLKRLNSVFTHKLFEIHQFVSDLSILNDAVKFILNFKLEIEDELWQVALKVFDEEIFMNYVDRADSREKILNVLTIFKSKVDVKTLKLIKKQLVTFDLWENIEILTNASMNSELIHVIEFLQMPKTLSIEDKLNLLNNSKMVTSSEKINLLLNHFKSVIGNQKSSIPMIIRALLENPSLMAQFFNSNGAKNRQAILMVVKKHLGFREAKELAEVCRNEIGKLILKLYFRASSSLEPIIESNLSDSSVVLGFFESFANDALNNSTYSPSTKMQLIIKSFKLSEEIERLYEIISVPDETLIKLTESLYSLLMNKQTILTGPTAVYSVHKMTRRLSSKKRERTLIMRRLILTSPQPRSECVDAFLQAQLHSKEIDWELHKDLTTRTREWPRVQSILKEFEADYKID